ncbi:MAG: ABC transporter permease [Acidimicrobiales bacterium]
MTFIGLIVRNVGACRLRATLTGAAVAIAVMAVVALGTLTSSLKASATGILTVGNADLTVAQRHVDNVLNSTISTADIEAIGKVPGVEASIGALVQLDRYDAANPGVIQGLDPAAQERFGVVLLEGRSYAATAPDEVMLGYELAQAIHKRVGDELTMDGHRYRVTGLYRTNVSFGNATMMFPLPVLQGRYTKAGFVTLGFVKVAPGAPVDVVRRRIDQRFPQLAGVASEADDGLVDNTLVLIGAANTGGAILAAVIAISGVLNTSLLSFFERIREFGVLRSIGWSRRRVMALARRGAGGELVGALVGLLLGWAAINVLQHLSALRCSTRSTRHRSSGGRSCSPSWWRSSAPHPALRAAFLSPLEAMRRE